MMLESHEIAKRDGVVYNLYGRPRRIPEAKRITKIYGNLPHGELPYVARSWLNLAMNHRVQSTAASIVNRAAIISITECLR
jgi:DNA polymerase I-like protein with 3'-5' exonuclease and polymerase domains